MWVLFRSTNSLHIQTNITSKTLVATHDLFLNLTTDTEERIIIKIIIKKYNVTKITFSCAFTRCLVFTYIMLSIYNPFSLHKMAPRCSDVYCVCVVK